jgi:uncharacterized membrane protein
MNQAHFHLLVNHVPILFPIAGFLTLLTGFFFKSGILKRMAYGLFIIGSIFAFTSMLSGEGAEEIVEEIGGISHDVIHEHEEQAESFAIIPYLLGILSILAIIADWKKNRLAQICAYGVLICSFLVIYMGSQTGTSGGEIRHTEIRKQNGSIEASAEHNEDEHHDE